jgi:hypothetical protein
VYSAPVINPGITGSDVQISGDFVEADARALAAMLQVVELLPVTFDRRDVEGTSTSTTTTIDRENGPVANRDHWHAMLGVNVCGRWLPNAPQFEYRAGQGAVQAGLHTHGDGLVHVHPFTPDEAGANATLGRFVEYGGWRLDDDSFELWDGNEHRNGETCAGARATVRWSVDGEEREGDPADVKVDDGQVIALALLPEGVEIGTPPETAVPGTVAR